jgi:hypothetical protein
MISDTIESYDQDAASKRVIRALHAETFVFLIRALHAETFVFLIRALHAETFVFLASQHIVASIFSDNCYHNDTIINVKSDT